MQAPAIPADEEQRLAALRALRVLDTPPEAEYDNIVRLASTICGTPIALISLVDHERQWFKARVGLDAAQTGRTESFCAHTVASAQPLIVSNALCDERFADNPLVTGDPNIRFYAGIPVRGPAGQVKGTVCVIDREPRQLSDVQLAMLELLARQVEGLLRNRQTELLLEQRERELAAKQLLIDEAVDTVGGTLWDWDLRSGVIRQSHNRARALGYERGELREHIDEWVAMTHPDDVDAVFAATNAHLKGETPYYHAHLRQRTKSGGWLWFVSRGKVIEWDYRGQPIRMVGAAVNINDQKLAEQQLRDQARQAESFARAQAQFLATMAHEIRTPLNSIVGGAQLALLEQESAKQGANLQMVQDAAQHLYRLVNSVLDFSRIESGHLRLEQAALSVGHIFESLRDQFAALAQRKGLALHLEVDPSVPAVLVGDSLRITQVLMNFVSNAIKFTDAGSVEVRASAQVLDATHSSVHFTVRDSGVGMTPAQMERLFVPFAQADESVARRFGGTGLGLVIARKLVQLMNGEVQLHSAPGEGTEVSCIVPLQRRANEAAANDSAPPAPPGAGITHAQLREAGQRIAGRRVLVVDDNPMNILVATRFLEKAGLKVDAVESGEQAIARIETSPYDFVLMDLHMPGMDGVQAAERIRGLPHARGLPIIAVSASVTPEERARCLGAGMEEFVSKPIHPLRLLGVMEALLQRTHRLNSA